MDLIKLSEMIEEKESKIAEVENKIVSLKTEKLYIEEENRKISSKHFIKIAFDSSLKNETQRKARLELMLDTDLDYQQNLEKLKELDEKIQSETLHLKLQKANLEHLKRLYEIHISQIKQEV
ncbi:hypothetical protein [Persephonella sp.]